MAMMSGFFTNVRGVLFDLDGTLVDTNIDFPLMLREMHALANSCGIAGSRIDGLDILAVVDYVVASLEEASEWERARFVRKEALLKLEEIEVAHSMNARIVKGAQELLERLRKTGINIGIVTRNCRRAVECSIERTGLIFDVLLTRDDVPCVKPHPDHVLRALAALDIRPENAVTVGDHTLDIRCGKSAGTKTVGFLRKRRPDDFFDAEAPDMVIRDLNELLLHLPA